MVLIFAPIRSSPSLETRSTPPWGSTTEQLKQINNNLKEMGVQVCQFFHEKVTHLITSNHCLERAEKERTASNKLLKDQSSRGAMFLARAMKKANNCNIFGKAKKFGIKIVLIEERKLQIKSTSRREATVTHTNSIEEIPPVVKVRRLKELFIKVVDRSESYRPLVLEMKEWPDALTMFSQGTNILQDAGIKKGTLQTHLDSRKHINNASDAKNWAGVDALISKMPSVETIIERELENRQDVGKS